MNKKGRLGKRIASLLLCLMMVLSIVNLPGFTTTVHAAEYNEGDISGTTGIGTKANPVVCDTYDEFKAAMENASIQFVTLQSVSGANGMIPAKNSLGTVWAGISVTNQKTLTLDGDSVFVAGTSSTNMPADRLIHVESSGNLIVEGNGSITFKTSLSNGSNAVIFNQGNTTINSNLVGLYGSYNTASYGRAIFCDYGNVTIYGGTFTGVSAIKGDTRNMSALYARGGFVLIDGGVFESYAINGAMSTCYGAEICEDTVLVRGTFTNGILCKGDISSYVDGNSTYSIEEDGSLRVYIRPHQINVSGNGNARAVYDGVTISERDCGERVNLVADARLSDGKVFDRWVCESVEIINSNTNNEAYFVMPGYDVNITAVYKTSDLVHTITVLGEGNPGAYFLGSPITEQEEGKAVALSTNEYNANGDAFDHWMSDDVTINNASEHNAASFMMPNKSVVVKAVYIHVHTASEAVTKNLIEASCSEGGSYDSVVYCSICNAEMSRIHHTMTATGNHDFSQQPYQTDDAGKHYQKCKDCGAESTHEAHTGGTATCKEKAKCTVCGEEYGSLAAHTYATKWSSDGTNHWHACTVCGAKKDSAAHTLKTTTTKATFTANGKKETNCSVCGKVTKTTTIYAAKTIKLSATAYTYDGKVKKPTVTVKDSKGNAIASTNYTVTYPTGRKNVGKYTVKVTFKGNYSGSKSLTFKINPPKTAISSVSAGKKAFTVKWSKKTTQVTGYQIQYSTSSSFASGNKTVTVTSNKTVSKTISKLTGGKKYYVRVRTYKTVSGTKYYSDWSAKKSITTKK